MGRILGGGSCAVLSQDCDCWRWCAIPTETCLWGSIRVGTYPHCPHHETLPDKIALDEDRTGIQMDVNYQKMYATLCGAISDALDQLPENEYTIVGRITLEEALAKTEELYYETTE